MVKSGQTRFNECSLSLPPGLFFILRQWFTLLLQNNTHGTWLTLWHIWQTAEQTHTHTPHGTDEETGRQYSKHSCSVLCHLLAIPAWISLTQWHTETPLTHSLVVCVCAYTTRLCFWPLRTSVSHLMLASLKLQMERENNSECESEFASAHKLTFTFESFWIFPFNCCVWLQSCTGCSIYYQSFYVSHRFKGYSVQSVAAQAYK